jgi:hypothetical protein
LLLNGCTTSGHGGADSAKAFDGFLPAPTSGFRTAKPARGITMP